MGTRAVITFKDEVTKQKYCVYQHWDGDPHTVTHRIKGNGKCWRWPRYEADEFAAAYIATYKTAPGDIRITTSAKAHGDLSYAYEVTAQKNAQGGIECLKVVIKDCYTNRKIGTEYITPEVDNGRS